MEAILQDKNMKRICALIIVMLWAYSVFAGNTMPGDSVGLKQQGNQSFILYKVGQGETIYAVSRKYGISYASIQTSNPDIDLNKVQVGQQIMVPIIGKSIPILPENVSSNVNNLENETRLHVVVKGETLYRISRNYQVEFSDLIKANSIAKDYALKIGDKIIIPASGANDLKQIQNNELVDNATAKNTQQDVIKETANISTTNQKNESLPIQDVAVISKTRKEDPSEVNSNSIKNILGTNDTIENITYNTNSSDKSKSFAQIYADYNNDTFTSNALKGVATWIDGSSSIKTVNDRYYALQNGAPIGSIIKVRNLMNNRVVYAKVIGTLSESEVNEKVTVKLSSGVAEKLNVLDNRFVVETTFFTKK